MSLVDRLDLPKAQPAEDAVHTWADTWQPHINCQEYVQLACAYQRYFRSIVTRKTRNTPYNQ